MPDTLADWLTYLETLHPKTIALGLERVAQIKQRLNLQPDFPIIVVGGTNGKGSRVCDAGIHPARRRIPRRLLYFAASAALQRARAHRQAAGDRCGVVRFI